MPNDQLDPVHRDQNRSLEVRAAVDVMFEALSHIQASLETESEEKRVKSYKKFKEALYDRFEHLLEKRRGSTGDGAPAGTDPTLTNDEAVVEDASDSDEGDDEDDDTLEKLWPAIATK